MGTTDELGERLPGGNVGGAWRVGDTVRRATGPWTPAVHALLAHLDGRLDAVPRVLGYDDRGRESLTYLEGRVVDVDSERLTDAQLGSLVRWTRRFHTAVEGFRHDGPWRHFHVDDPTIVGHNDIALYNACFDGDEVSGVFDWDLAGPTTPLFELAFIAWNCVPLWVDIGSAAAALRIQVIADAYGGRPGCTATDILDAVGPRVRVMLDGIPVAAAAGDAGMAQLMRLGEPGRSQVTLDDLLRRTPGIAAHLGRVRRREASVKHDRWRMGP